MTRKLKIKLGLASIGLVLFLTFQNFTESDAVVCKTDGAIDAIAYCISQKSHPLLKIIVDEQRYTCSELQNLCSTMYTRVKVDQSVRAQPAVDLQRGRFDHIGN